MKIISLYAVRTQLLIIFIYFSDELLIMMEDIKKCAKSRKLQRDPSTQPTLPGKSTEEFRNIVKNADSQLRHAILIKLREEKKDDRRSGVLPSTLNPHFPKKKSKTDFVALISFFSLSLLH